MSMRRNIAINYMSQIYVALVGIAMVPFYIKYMGVEAYGLVGFFAVVQAWMLLLDMGFSPLLVREMARFRAGALDLQEIGRLVRCLECALGLMALLAASSIFFASDWIAFNWLTFDHMEVRDVAFSVAAMGGMVGVRWLNGVYRSAFVGLDRQLLLGLTNAGMFTLRSVGVLFVLHYLSVRPTGFFLYQFIVIALELLLTGYLFYREGMMAGIPLRPKWPLLFQSRWRFVGGMAYLTLLWGGVTQTDKLLLSHWLDMSEYGCYSAAITAAGGVSLVSVALVQSVQPRLVWLFGVGDKTGLIKLYRGITQFAAACLMAMAGIMVFLAQPLLWMWTNNVELASRASNVLGLYAMGNALYALQSIAFLLQFAKGATRWHMAGSTMFAICWLPALVYSVVLWGAEGAGWVWFLGNLLFLTVWITYVHGKIEPGIEFRWLFGDVMLVSLASILPAYLGGLIGFQEKGPVEFFVFCCAVGLTSILSGLLAGNISRAVVRDIAMVFLRKLSATWHRL